MKRFFLNPLFLFGIIVRLMLVAFVFPVPITEWYVPFLDVSFTSFNFDPWAVWLDYGGNPAAFPYGYVMWLIFLPLTYIFKIFNFPLIYGYGCTIILVDFILLLLFRRMTKSHNWLLLTVYWLSPIVIVASYVFGFNDLIPIMLLVASLYYLKHFKLVLSGIIFVAAISAKLSMILALPFFFIYILHNRALRQFLPEFIKGAVVGTVIMLLPFFIFSHSGTSMLFSNPEMGKVYRLAINFGTATLIYIVPLFYFLVLYMIWRVRRLNFELFYSMMGVAFLMIVLMTPASPGWFIWVIPLLVYYQSISDGVAVTLVAMFSALYVVINFFLNQHGGFSINQLQIWSYIYSHSSFLEGRFLSLMQTSMVAVGVVLTARIWRETVSRNDYFRLSRKPFVIGVAGDSGSGKDTFSDAIKGLFGSHSVATLSGDDYHVWDRQKPMWQVMTHLNPMANDLEAFASDLVALTDCKSIQSRHYDHKTGYMSRPFKVKSNDIIIASGLHALYLNILRECYDLSIFLDIDEGLRKHFKLQRDVNQRGHTVEQVKSLFEKREQDSARFIRPQASYADLILSLQPISHNMLNDRSGKHQMRFKLIVRSRHGLNELSLRRVLIGICGLHVDMIASNDASEVELAIEGETTASDIALAAKMICPKILEFLDIHPKWQDGVLGLMQLITLSHINQALTRRFI